MASIDIEWSNVFTVGDKQIDDEHQQQFRIIQKFCEACGKEHAVGRADQMHYLSKLIEYTEDHFLREEEALRELHGKTPRQHSNEHNDLLKEISLLEEFFLKDEFGDAAKAYPCMLMGWFVRHLMLHDKPECRPSDIAPECP